MAVELDLTFDDLVEYRRQLQEFCRGQVDGVRAFKKGASFQVHQDEGDLDSNQAHHLSSSATCYESLIAYSQRSVEKSDSDPQKDARDFVKLALQRPKWTSDGSAEIYCRCRTLPLVIRLVESATDELQQHIGTILTQANDPDRLAIGEAAGDKRQNWYPPNAYHTYWTLVILERFQRRFKEKYEKLQESLHTAYSITRLSAEMLLWARKTTGFEIGLHAAESPAADSDQLAWAMAIEFWFGGGFGADVGQRDFLRLGLKCLFSRQNKVGIWRTGRPLFHYKESGNAYCYVFETFTVLLTCGLSARPSAGFLRDALKPYMQHLLRLWQYAVSTRTPLEDSTAFGWSSGHRSNRTDPESWATASVYSYGNCLRRLFGIWAREAASRELPISVERQPEADAVSKIGDRGDTWSKSVDNVAVKLMTIFVNPVLSKSPGDSLEPDDERIQKHQARGAILFGPPGTSKTTLARAIAAAIGWQYVELHASHFVADGLGEVHRTADRIFKRLMQLDRAVILFDEIDELVREREAKSDAFGRFLTTSMLPKLAELWNRRSVIYFVATNHIDYFDSAIIRAERFDVTLHVPPPSFDKKIARLQALLDRRGVSIPIDLDRKSIEKSLQKFQIDYNSDNEIAAKEEKGLQEDQILAKFLLLRWDQLEELAATIAKSSKVKRLKSVDVGLLKKALQEMPDPFLDKASSYVRYLKSEKYERRDYSKLIVWEVQPCVPEKKHSGIRTDGSRCWYESFDFDLPSEFSKIGLGRIAVKEAKG